MERKAVIFQKLSALHVDGKILPIEINPPRPLYAPVLGLKIFLSCFT